MSDQSGIHISLDSLIKLRAQASSFKFISHKNTAYSASGMQTSRFRGRGIDFDEVRAYQPGDDIRNMDWRVTARTGKPHTKLYREERERPVYFIVDFNPTMYFGSKVAFKSVVAAKLTSILAWAGCLQGHRIGGLIFNAKHQQTLKPRSGKFGVLPLLKIMSEFSHPQDNTPDLQKFDLNWGLKQLRSIVKPGSLIFLISDFSQDINEIKLHLNSLAMHNEMMMCYVYDNLETALPPPNHYAITHGKDIFHFNTFDQDLCERYQQAFKDKYQALQKFCFQRQISFLPFTTETDIIKKLTGYFSIK